MLIMHRLSTDTLRADGMEDCLVANSRDQYECQSLNAFEI